MLKVALAVAGLAVLAACATLTEEQCQSGDWYGIGYEDGSNGKPLSWFSRHVEACSKHGVTPRQTPWRQGREDGLRVFCVPERAYEIGRRGKAMPAVCTPAETVDMRPAWDWGHSYYRYTKEIDDIEATIDERLEALKAIEDPEDPRIELYLLYNSRDRRDIRRLERRRDRYAYWP